MAKDTFVLSCEQIFLMNRSYVVKGSRFHFRMHTNLFERRQLADTA